MPGSSYLLDTNAAIAVLNEAEALSHVPEQSELYLSCVTLGELVYVARRSARAELNLERIRSLSAVCPVIGCDEDSAHHYGRLKNHLRAKGRPIPDNDLWIAAIAVQYGLILLTRDSHFYEFNELDELVTQSW